MQTFEEQLATAIVAKMANMTLRDVDEKTTHTSSSGPATKIDPMMFVGPPAQTAPQITQQHVEQIKYTNQLAEQLCPLPPPSVSQTVPVTSPEVNSNTSQQGHPLQSPVTLTPNTSYIDTTYAEKIIDVLIKIDNTLNKLVTAIDNNSTK